MEDLVLKFDLTVAETNQVLIALGKMPLEESVAVWAKIKQSAEAQIAEAAPVEE